MALYRLLKHGDFDSEDLHALARAYEGVLMDLKIKSREDPLTEVIAKKIFDYAKHGELDAIRLRQIVREEIKGSW
jgi:hypothetical protein